MNSESDNNITLLTNEIENLSRSIDAISERLRVIGIERTYETHNVIAEATLVETRSDEEEISIGDRVIVTNDYKNKKGTIGIVLRTTARYVRIGTASGELIYRSRANVRVYN